MRLLNNRIECIEIIWPELGNLRIYRIEEAQVAHVGVGTREIVRTVAQSAAQARPGRAKAAQPQSWRRSSSCAPARGPSSAAAGSSCAWWRPMPLQMATAVPGACARLVSVLLQPSLGPGGAVSPRGWRSCSAHMLPLRLLGRCRPSLAAAARGSVTLRRGVMTCVKCRGVCYAFLGHPSSMIMTY